MVPIAVLRITRLERDVSQKRSLLEDLRLKLRLANEQAKSNLLLLEEKSDEILRVKSTMEQNKVAV